MGFIRSSARELAARSERTQDRADRATRRGDPWKGTQLSVKALRQFERAERKAGRR